MSSAAQSQPDTFLNVIVKPMLSVARWLMLPLYAVYLWLAWTNGHVTRFHNPENYHFPLWVVLPMLASAVLFTKPVERWLRDR